MNTRKHGKLTRGEQYILTITDDLNVTLTRSSPSYKLPPLNEHQKSYILYEEGVFSVICQKLLPQFIWADNPKLVQ